MLQRFTPSALPLATVVMALMGTTNASAITVGDIGTWNCVGSCGTSAANGDITLSPLGHATYSYVTTANSEATQVSHLAIEESGGKGAKFTQTNGSAYVSQGFTVLAGEALDSYFNYVSTDGKGFDDYAWARLVNAGTNATAAWLFMARSTNSNTGQVVPGDALSKASNNSVSFDPNTTIVDYGSFNFNTRDASDPIDWSPLDGSNGACWKSNAPGCGFTGWLHSQVTPGAGTYFLEVGVVNFGDRAYDSGLAFDIAGLTAAVPEPGTWALMLGGTAWLAARRRRQG